MGEMNKKDRDKLIDEMVSDAFGNHPLNDALLSPGFRTKVVSEIDKLIKKEIKKKT